MDWGFPVGVRLWSNPGPFAFQDDASGDPEGRSPDAIRHILQEALTQPLIGEKPEIALLLSDLVLVQNDRIMAEVVELDPLEAGNDLTAIA